MPENKNLVKIYVLFKKFGSFYKQNKQEKLSI